MVKVKEWMYWVMAEHLPHHDEELIDFFSKYSSGLGSRSNNTS